MNFAQNDELKEALRNLNNAAYIAARIARKMNHPLTADLKALALKSDDLFEVKS